MMKRAQGGGFKLQTKVMLLLTSLTLIYVIFFWRYSHKEKETPEQIVQCPKNEPCPLLQCPECPAQSEVHCPSTELTPNILINKKQLYSCEIPKPNFKSQVAQDSWIYKRFFTNRCGGVYLDIGAHDGQKISNSYFFETQANWRGMCVEPNPETFRNLSINRPRSVNINAVLGTERKKMTFRVVRGVEVLSGLLEFMDPRHLDRIEGEKKQNGLKDEDIYDVQVDMIPTTELLEVHDMTNIDFLSLDTEGSELQILKSFDWDKIRVHVMTVENNFRSTEVKEFLNTKGIQWIHNLSGQDDVYEDPNYCKKTGICES